MARPPEPAAGRPPQRRVFFALWPGEEVRAALARLAEEVLRECGGRIMRAPNIHLTLVFVGDIPAGRVEALERIAASVAAPTFELTLDSLGYWRHNRIAWAGTREIPEALSRLVTSLSAPLAAAGFRVEERPYVPHVTLVRDARRAPQLRSIEPIAWRAADFALVESARRDGRSSYEVLRSWPLRGV